MMKISWKKEDKLFLACSGGMDSVVLGHLLKKAGYFFEILHVNFQLRAEESERDEMFVRALADEWEMPVRVKRFDTLLAMKEMGAGVQVTARNLRYAWFDEVLKDDASKKKWLLTAHHADDQVETAVMNFFRGTGIAGLRGMKEINGNLVRPLLTVLRHQLEEYARENNLNWVEDSSNLTTDYSRNFFRLEVMPLVEKVFPSFKQNVLDNCNRLKEIEMIYGASINQIREKLLKEQGGSLAVSVKLLQSMQPLDTILYEIFSPYGFYATQIRELKKLFESPSGKYINSETHRVLRNRNWLLIDPLVAKSLSIQIIEQDTEKISFHGKEISFQKMEGQKIIDSSPLAVSVDLEKISYPLIIRPWKAGDYFYPLGMEKKKKIAKFLTDLKLSVPEKENQFVIESDKKIIWVIGRRIDERVKVSSSTRFVLHIQLS